jgi:hypothetical protein
MYANEEPQRDCEGTPGFFVLSSIFSVLVDQAASMSLLISKSTVGGPQAKSSTEAD